MTYEENIQMIRREVKEEITNSLIDTLALPFITAKVGVDMEKVANFKQEYKQRLKKAKGQ
ncbi:hypothetical protein [Oceanobacillus oncorhynchi]|uniref:hypothetical protein n=1 Tax=Oceanobacillus oncorhynchi TaxID=545501 RepID=UPI0034D491FA